MTTPFVKTPITAAIDDIVMLYDGTSEEETYHYGVECAFNE